MHRVAVIFVVLFCVVGCGDADTSGPPSTNDVISVSSTMPTADPSVSSGQGCADVIAVEHTRAADGTHGFDVTVSSADTGWDKYADAWEVRSPDGGVLGTRELTHPHETEQPFTRSLAGVDIPVDLSQVTVAARDSVAGFCGSTVSVAID